MNRSAIINNRHYPAVLVKWRGTPHILSALKTAITEWITTTEEGGLAWKQSLFNFNVNDLRDYHLFYGDTTNKLYLILAKHDIVDLMIESFANAVTIEEWQYDTVLVNMG
jgi:hypothetical protein